MVPKGNLPIPDNQLEDPDKYEKVIVRIDHDEIANVTIPISTDHALNNRLFHPIKRDHTNFVLAKIF